MKWTCFICGEVVQRFSLVCDHVEKHKQDEQKPSSLSINHKYPIL